MKKFLALLLVVLLVLSTFAACNSGNSTETEKPTDEQTEKDTEKETEKQTEKETEKQTENSGDNSGNNNAGDNNTGDNNTGDNDNTGDDDTKPEEPKAYFFGMVQANVDAEKVFYLTGEMSGYYMATTDKSAEALEVFLEATEGGYYLYCVIDEVKTYINMVVSGTHVNGAYEATASTVYTLDETLNTLKANVTVAEDESKSGEYWFGTRNDKTFTTVGPVLVKYEGFFCKLYDAIVEDVVPCEHDYVEGTCTKCGEADPDYVAPCEHDYVEGTCTKCGEADPDYVAPCEHDYVDGACTKCGEADPDYVAPCEHDYVDGACTKCGEADPDYVAPCEHDFVDGTCTKCGEADPDYVAPCEHDYVDGACTKCGEADPNYVAITPIADAIAAADGTEVTVRGIVVEIVSGWNEQYNNISVNIIDDAGNVLYLYRTGVNCVVGDLVTVTGNMGTYGGSRQLAQGSTGEVSVATDAYKVAYEYYQISTMDTYFKGDAERYLITEPTKYAATIVWTNADGETVTEFNIPQTDALQEVVFTLTITVGNATFTKDITITVEAKPQTGLTTLATFEFGENVDVSGIADESKRHKDGSEVAAGVTFESGAYTLVLDSVAKVYDGANDKVGTSCIKLGTGSKAASLSFTVGDDVKQVVVKIAKYKANATKISVNGGEAQELTKNSDNGEYDEIIIDTTTNKTVNITTLSGGYRAMIDSITYMG